jgi:hypothetical protein
MKKIVMLIAAAAMTVSVAFAQDINAVTDIYNNGAMELEMGNKESALNYFQSALTEAEALGEAGAEIIAKGDITVWGILGGIAHAGSDGNNYARIRALKLNPVQIRIGEVFARRPDTVNLPYIQKSSEYVPEEAFTYKGSIVIRKIHDEN